MLRRNDERFEHGTCFLHREESGSSKRVPERKEVLHRTMQRDLMSTSCSEIFLPSKERVVRYFLSRTSLNHDSVISMMAKDLRRDVEWD